MNTDINGITNVGYVESGCSGTIWGDPVNITNGCQNGTSTSYTASYGTQFDYWNMDTDTTTQPIDTTQAMDTTQTTKDTSTSDSSDSSDSGTTSGALTFGINVQLFYYMFWSSLIVLISIF